MAGRHPLRAPMRRALPSPALMPDRQSTAVHAQCGAIGFPGNLPRLHAPLEQKGITENCLARDERGQSKYLVVQLPVQVVHITVLHFAVVQQVLRERDLHCANPDIVPNTTA